MVTVSDNASKAPQRAVTRPIRANANDAHAFTGGAPFNPRAHLPGPSPHPIVRGAREKNHQQDHEQHHADDYKSAARELELRDDPIGETADAEDDGQDNEEVD